LIVIVYVAGGPVHGVIVGVTVIVPVMGEAVVLVPTNDGTFPAPPAARPIAVFEFVQLNVAPAGVLAKALAGIVAPAQTVMLGIGVTTGFGLTVIVYVSGIPGQGFPAIVGVTVTVEVIGVLPALTVVKDGTLPEPLAPRPIAVFELVQVYVAPTGVLVNAVSGASAPAQ
jgi:hypothetical protein